MLATLTLAAIASTAGLTTSAVALSSVSVGKAPAVVMVLVVQQYGIDPSRLADSERQALEEAAAKAAAARANPGDAALRRAAAREIAGLSIAHQSPQSNTVVLRYADGPAVLARLYAKGMGFVYKLEDLETGESVAEVIFPPRQEPPEEAEAWRLDLIDTFKELGRAANQDQRDAILERLEKVLAATPASDAPAATVLLEVNGQVAMLYGEEATRERETEEILALWPNLSPGAQRRLERTLHLLRRLGDSRSYWRTGYPSYLPAFIIERLPGDIGDVEITSEPVLPRLLDVLGGPPAEYVEKVLPDGELREIDYTRSFRAQVRTLLRPEP